MVTQTFCKLGEETGCVDDDETECVDDDDDDDEEEEEENNEDPCRHARERSTCCSHLIIETRRRHDGQDMTVKKWRSGHDGQNMRMKETIYQEDPTCENRERQNSRHYELILRINWDCSRDKARFVG